MRLSVIIPTYNRADLLLDCVKPCVKIHGGCSVEVLVVDDASKDKTQDVVRALSSQYGTDRVRYFRLACNAGAQVARNRGILEARGEYIMFVDSDDVPAASGINELCSVLKKQNHVDYAYGQVVITDMSLNPLGPRAVVGKPYDGSDAGLAGYHWHTMGALYRKRCVEKVGPWNVSLTGSQDWEYQARVKIAGGKGAFVDTFVGYWRQHGSDRIGADSFRPDYVKSAAKACCSIWSHACHARRNDPLLAEKLARRLLRHALEWGAAGYGASKQSCLQSAIEIASDDERTQLMLRMFARTPAWLDRLVVRITDARTRLR